MAQEHFDLSKSARIVVKHTRCKCDSSEKLCAMFPICVAGYFNGFRYAADPVGWRWGHLEVLVDAIPALLSAGSGVYLCIATFSKSPMTSKWGGACGGIVAILQVW